MTLNTPYADLRRLLPGTTAWWLAPVMLGTASIGMDGAGSESV
ncbi:MULTISPECIES: hypothetical protein [Nonomuraea]|uniref:Uncharacterized protein n=1 Tax=Nonomuraea mangrovi TaxID=2316207 RepID=A0ABW4SL74_9ACTN